MTLSGAGGSGVRGRLAIGLLLGWSALFAGVLVEWVRVALAADLHSHVILIPVVAAYLLWTGRGERKAVQAGNQPGGAVLILAGLIVWSSASWMNSGLDRVDGVAMLIAAYVIGVWGIAWIAMGWSWVRAALFPLGFLVFMIPLPGPMEAGLEKGLMVPSAWVSEWAFELGRIPVHREGQVLEIPGIVLVVAEECSGIRSTWVLLITSILAAHLFLPTLPRKLALVALVLPLGIFRNALRIFVIGWLCVEYGPEMIDHWLHRRGGPLFFAASLVPLFAAAWVLRCVGRRGKPVAPSLPSFPAGSSAAGSLPPPDR